MTSIYERMLAYHRGTWREGDKLPEVAALDTFCKRYGWTTQEYWDTPYDELEELSQVIVAEATYNEELEAEQLAETNKLRAKQGLPPLQPRRSRKTPVVQAPPAHAGKPAEQVYAEFYAD